MKKKFKEKSFIQSFDKNKKHLSDTEDSLILSEKKGKRRTSGGLRGSVNASQNGAHQQSQSSIVDVKIKPAGKRRSVSPALRERESGSSSRSLRKNKDLDYAVQSYNDTSVNGSANKETSLHDSRSHNH